MWPYHYAGSLAAWYPHQQYSQWLINPSALAIRLGMPALLADGISAGVLIISVQHRFTGSVVGGASFAGLLAVATSLHANPHEAALLLPALFFVMTTVGEPLPWRTRVVAIAYALGGISIFRWFISFDPITLLVAFGTLSYLAVRLVYPRAGDAHVLIPKPLEIT